MDRTHFVMADHHIPFTDWRAVEVAHKICRAAKPDVIHLLGDVLDFATLSRFRDSERYEHTVQDEIDEAVDYLQRLNREFKSAEIVYHMGNHDRRLAHYLWSDGKKIKGLRSTRFKRQFMLDDNDEPTGIRVKFQDRKLLLARGTFVMKHGSRYGLHVGKLETDDEGRSGICGHNHRTDTWSWRTPGYGEVKFEHLGCLCGLDPPYMEEDGKPTHWNHGCAVMTERGKEVGVENIWIHKYRALWRGKEYHG